MNEQATEMTEQGIEDAIQAAGLNAPRITPDHITSRIAREQFYRFPGSTVTVCCLTLVNGFNVIGHSAAASPENFDEKIGRDIAYTHARDRIWELEGYLLRQQLAQAELRESTGKHRS